MKKKGFTLVETIGVIIVIALIALVTIPLIINSNDRNLMQEQEKADIISSLDFYFDANPELKKELINNGNLIISKEALLNEGYISEIKYYNQIKIIYKQDGIYDIESVN